MSAKILVQSGIAAGTSHWIERNVVRVGSDPGMDLTVPCDALDKHALTLEYRDGVYRVHNRCTVQVYLGGRTVSPGHSDQWHDTDLLELPGLIQLALEVDGDPAPAPPPLFSPAPVSASMDNDGPDAGPDVTAPAPYQSQPSGAPDRANASVARVGQPSPSSSSSTMLQLGVIVVCVLGCVLLLARDRMRRSADSAVSVPRFEVIVDQAREKSDPITQSLLRHVQYAESAMIRGNTKAARQRYASVRSMLLANPDPAIIDSQSTPDPLQRQMMQWVEYRLGQL